VDESSAEETLEDTPRTQEPVAEIPLVHTEEVIASSSNDVEDPVVDEVEEDKTGNPDDQVSSESPADDTESLIVEEKDIASEPVDSTESEDHPAGEEGAVPAQEEKSTIEEDNSVPDNEEESPEKGNADVSEEQDLAPEASI